MATRDTPWPAGTPCLIDLTVTDFDEAAEFYSTLFGWSVTPGGSEMGRYAIATMDDRPVAGLAPQMDPNQALPGWITYLATDDVDATARKIHDAGGSVLMDPMDVLDEGRIALALDPGGALFGLWQARRHIGFEDVRRRVEPHACLPFPARAKPQRRSLGSASLPCMPRAWPLMGNPGTRSSWTHAATAARSRRSDCGARWKPRRWRGRTRNCGCARGRR